MSSVRPRRSPGSASVTGASSEVDRGVKQQCPEGAHDDQAPDAAPATSQPAPSQRHWPSGRTLSETQLAKKRERDRCRQRELRRSTLDRVEQVSRLLEERLEQKDADVRSLQAEISRLKLENEALRAQSWAATGSSQNAPAETSLLGYLPQDSLRPGTHVPLTPVLEPNPSTRSISLKERTPTHYIVECVEKAKIPLCLGESGVSTSSPNFMTPGQAIQVADSEHVLELSDDLTTSRLPALPLLLQHQVQHLPLMHPAARFEDFTAIPLNSASRCAALSQSSGGPLPSRHIQLGSVTVVNCSVELINGIPTNLDPEGTSIAQIINWALSEILKVPRHMICTDDLQNQDAILRGVMDGWDSVRQRGYFCPLWGILRFIDDHVFWCSGYLARLCILRMIQYMLMCQLNSSQVSALPPWYRPRPVQYRNPHEIVIGYWAWPMLRERFILSDKSWLTNQFWCDFAQGYHFHWPFEGLESIYNVDQQTGLLRFTGRFLNSVGDIRTYLCKSSFYEKYPDLYDDIAPAAPLNTLLIPASSARHSSIWAHNSTQSGGDEVEVEEVIYGHSFMGASDGRWAHSPRSTSGWIKLYLGY